MEQLEVSTHAPARGATQRAPRIATPLHRFNSRAREGRDILRAYFDDVLKVSTHAPARGATLRLS